MTLDEKLRQIGACECETRMNVTLASGKVISGMFADYTEASDNVEEIASIDVENESGIYCLFENEITSIETIRRGDD
jgi:hypothetical protein